MDRTARTFLLAVVGLALFGLVRPDSRDPQENDKAAETRFYILKTQAGPDYDGVVIGDSRALHAVSPGVVGERIAGFDLFNFAFNSGGMNTEMFDAAESLLDPEGERPTILVAATPLSLQGWKTGNAQYREYLAKPADQVWFHRDFADLAHFFRPFSPAYPVRHLLGMEPRYPEWHVYHDDGWIETTAAPQPFEKHWDVVRKRLAGNSVSDALIDGLLERVASWEARGIRVVGFSPPATATIAEIEREVLGFDPARLRDGFEAAGAEWLEFETDGYTTYDGSHLDADSARRFSAALAEALTTD